jgi:hypothetical protein
MAMQAIPLVLWFSDRACTGCECNKSGAASLVFTKGRPACCFNWSGSLMTCLCAHPAKAVYYSGPPGALFTKWQASGKNDIILKAQAILQEGSVALEFMTEDALEAEEMRAQRLEFDCVAEVRVPDLPGLVELRSGAYAQKKLYQGCLNPDTVCAWH